MADNNSEPYEIIAAPFTVWWGEIGVDFPLIDATPDTNDWNLVGSSGDLNYEDGAGVTVGHNQSITKWRALGDCGVRKAFRTEEDQTVKLTLVDMTLEQYAHALNMNTVDTVPAGGEAGYKKIGLSRGFSIKTVQLLVRGPSPEMPDGVAQYEIPRCMQTGSPEVVYKKGTPAGLALEWTALVDADAQDESERFGRLLIQTDAAVS
jgi:hypothetical protein